MIFDLDQKHGPGRPPRIVRRPSPRQEARIKAHQDAAREHEHLDAVVRVAATRDSVEALMVLREQMAREAAALLFQRLQTLPGARDAGRLSSRRVKALAEVASLSLEIARAAGGVPSPATVEQVLHLLQLEVEEVVTELFGAEDARRFLYALKERLSQDPPTVGPFTREGG